MRKRKIALITALVFGSLLLVNVALAASYLLNGGFETGSLSGWTCDGTCSAETGTDAYAGAYYARRAADSTLTQAATVQDCADTYRLLYAARQYSAGTYTIDAGFGDCGLTSDTYTPAEPGEGWSLHYLDIAPCDGDLDYSVEFGGTGSSELDAVSLICLGSSAGGAAVGAYTELMDDGQALAVYPTATFGDLALALGIFATVAVLIIIAIILALRMRGSGQQWGA